jgi:DNA modification methylase
MYITSYLLYDPEKYCPTCFRKFKRHATRKRIGDHRHYPIFAVCNSNGKNPGNVWEISTKAHYGNEHFAIFPEDLIARIVTFASMKDDWVLDPFCGRGTTGIVCALLGRNFTGIDLYKENVVKTERNIKDAMSGKIKVRLDNVEDNNRITELIPLENYIQ